MIRNVASNAAFAALVLLSLPLAAATEQKPGLWSNTIKIDMGQGMPQIDPAMLEQMEQMGIEIPIAKPMTQQVCLTPEQVKKNALPDVTDADSGCTSRNVKRQGDRITGDLECNGQIVGKGNLQMTLASAESYSGSTSFKGATREGIPVNMLTEFSGRWLSADCGQVQPYVTP